MSPDPTPPPPEPAPSLRPVEELQALCDAATPGPWVRGWPNNVVRSVGPRRSAIAQPLALGNKGADAAFIAAARTALPSLLARLRAAEETLAAVGALTADYRMPRRGGSFTQGWNAALTELRAALAEGFPMTAEPRDVEEIRGDIARQRHREVLARLAAADRENAELRAVIAATATEVECYVTDRLADARQENAELRASNHAMIRLIREHNDVEAERDDLRAQLAEAERDRDEARSERDDAGLLWGRHYNDAMGALETQLAAAQAQLAEARAEVGRTRTLCDRYGIVSLDDALAELDGARTEADEARAELRREQDAMATLYGGFAAAAEARDNAEAQVLIQNGYTSRAATAAGLEQQRAEAAEARLAAVRTQIPVILAPIEVLRHGIHCTMRQAIFDGARCSCKLQSMIRGEVETALLAALSAAPQPEPEKSFCPTCSNYHPTKNHQQCADNEAKGLHPDGMDPTRPDDPEPPASAEPTGRSD